MQAAPERKCPPPPAPCRVGGWRSSEQAMTGKPSWNSHRFNKGVHLTRHPRKRMAQRGLSPRLVQGLIEMGQVKDKDPEHWWIFRTFEGREDNQICPAVVSREALIVKTSMTHWEVHEA
jgi:hypothetical protein